MSLLRIAALSPVSRPQKIARRRRQLGLLTLCSLGAPSMGVSMAHAKPFRAVGVKAWTSGSETFIRARPSAEVPPVAKVARHTPLYVWGKYNGWYRVETHDHIFGWVYNQYIEAPKDYKVRAMPESKARLASNRTASQTMYGSPALLKKHYAAFGAPGALKGLQKQGILVAAAPKTRFKAASIQKVLVAQAAVHPANAPKHLATKSTASKIRVRLAGAPNHPVHLAGAPGLIATQDSNAPASRRASPVPSAELTERRRRIEGPAAPAKIVAVPTARAQIKTARAPQLVAKTSPGENRAPALGRKSSAFTPPRVESLQSPTSPANRIASAPRDVPREVESGKISDSAHNLTPSAKFFARAASDEARRPSSRFDSPGHNNTGDGAPTGSEAATHPLRAPIALAPVAPRVRISSPARGKVAKKSAPKVATRRAKAPRYASRRDRQREQLRAKMGLSTSAPHSVIAPVSGAELLRARQEYLAGRKARLGLPSSPSGAPAGEVPVVGLAPLPIPSGPLGGPPDAPTPLAPALPGAFAPMSFEPSHPLAPLLGDPYILSLAQLKPQNTPELRPIGDLRPLPVSAASARGGSPRDRRAPLRGGSPRDRFGSAMASQALSYRGMPYIRGAASPNRGFDCSGLVYYLLTQRGYHPPRTAAGYANWGQKISKNQLKSGDLLLFANTYKRGISHIGVYLGEGKFVHAATSSTGVRVSSLNEAYYRGKYFGARRAK